MQPTNTPSVPVPGPVRVGHTSFHAHRFRVRRVALVLTIALAATTALIGQSGPAAAAPPVQAAATKPGPVKTPPPNPTDTQLNAAAAARGRAASDVGRLSGLIVGIDGRISHLNDVSELAGEKYLQARWNLGLARQAATKAQRAVTVAQQGYDKARARFRSYIAAAYMNRSGDSSGLLTAQNPNILLERNDLGRYTSVRQLDAIGTMTRATVAKANAVSRSRTAVALRAKLTDDANRAQRAAGQAVTDARVQRGTLVVQKGSYERQLTTAGEALTGLKNKRAAYVAWKILQARIKAEAARRARIARQKLLAAQARERARLARQARLDQLAQQRRDREAAQQRAQQQAQQRTQQQSQQRAQQQSQQRAQQQSQQRSQQQSQLRARRHNSSAPPSSAGNGGSSNGGSSNGGSSNGGSSNGGSSNGGSSNGGSSNGGSSNGGSGNGGSGNGGSGNGGSSNGGSSNGGSSNGNGSWSPAKGRDAVSRAERWLGTDYSFGAGGYSGPGYGACIAGVASDACHVYGFDCSGLTMYAWAPAGIYMPHYAASQNSYGSVHPSVDQLQPGDLTFWSSDGTVGGIHHVAIYVGNGNVVEAPHTGDVVKIAPIWSNGYFGATRPGT